VVIKDAFILIKNYSRGYHSHNLPNATSMSPFLISFIEKKKCKLITILNQQEYTTWTPLPTITKQRTIKLQTQIYTIFYKTKKW